MSEVLPSPHVELVERHFDVAFTLKRLCKAQHPRFVVVRVPRVGEEDGVVVPRFRHAAILGREEGSSRSWRPAEAGRLVGWSFPFNVHDLPDIQRRLVPQDTGPVPSGVPLMEWCHHHGELHLFDAKLAAY